MHHAKIGKSDRLRRVHALLRKRSGWVSTRNIMLNADVCAVNSCIAELRANGAEIACEQRMKNGQRVWYYRMLRPAKEQSNG